MRDRAVAHDDEVELGNGSRGIGEVGDRRVEVGDQGIASAGRQLGHSLALLQAEQADVGDAQQFEELLEGERTVAVVAMARAAAPHDTDLEAARERLEQLLQARLAPGIDLQVGDIGRDRLKASLEDARHREQWQESLERRQGVAADDHLVDAVEPGEQGFQSLAAFDHEALAARPDHGRIADELDRVAVALLGRQHDRAVDPASVPLPPGIAQVRRVAQLPARLVGGPAPVEVTLDQVGEREVPADVRQPRIELLGALEDLDCLVDQAGVLQGDAEVVDHAGVGGIDLHGTAEHVEGFKVPSGILEGIAEVAEGLDVARVALQRPAVAGDRLVELAFLAQGDAEVVERGDIARRDLEHTVVLLDRLAIVAGVLGLDRGVEQRLGASRSLLARILSCRLVGQGSPL